MSIKDGSKIAGTVLTITATVADAAGNIATKDYELKVYGKPTISYDKNALKVTEDALALDNVSVTFNLKGGSGNIKSQIVNGTNALVYPTTIPTRTGYAFTGWYIDSACTELYDFASKISDDITLYAGWKAMETSYYSRNYIDIYSKYNTSSNYYSLSTSNTSSSSYRYTYFTALEDGTYTLYYKNSNSSSSYGTYIYVYNVTKGEVITSNTKITSTSYLSVSFAANAGDVIYVRNYRYSTSYSATFYMYVTGGVLPKDGGLSVKPVAASVLNASATDSFGNLLTVTAMQEAGTLQGGKYVTYALTATDHLGNTATYTTDPIPVYDVTDIVLDYYEGMSDLIKLSSKGEEFNASATDSFGETCDVSIKVLDGYTLEGGNIVSLYIIATDKAGNQVVSSVIKNIKVYDLPRIIFNNAGYYVEESEDLQFLFTAYDSFNEELYFEVSYTGTYSGGNYIVVTVTTNDVANNSQRCNHY